MVTDLFVSVCEFACNGERTKCADVLLHCLTSLSLPFIEVVPIYNGIFPRDAELVNNVQGFAQFLCIFRVFPLEMTVSFLGYEAGTVEQMTDLDCIRLFLKFISIKK